MSYATVHDLLDDLDAIRPVKSTRRAQTRLDNKAAPTEGLHPGNTANKTA